MGDIILENMSGQPSTISAEALATWQGSMRGSLLTPSDDGYDRGRALWNGMIDRRPGAIVQCRGAADVINAVRMAAEHQSKLAVKGGGHNIAGNAVCDGGLTIDLSPMNSVRIDPTSRTAWVEPGATLGDFDREAQAFGLATPLGINSTTGVAGLTLGGGFGWLSRKHGLALDNLRAADVVLASGELVKASESTNAELFWGIRGGSGNFGVVTSFEFELHPVGPEVQSGLIVHPFENALDLLKGYREIAASMPDDLTCWVVLRKAPPLPFLPEEWHGKEVLVFAVCYLGDASQVDQAFAPLRALGAPIADVIGPNPYAGWQTAFDPLLTEGARNYWKSHAFSELQDGALQIMVDSVGNLPGPECEIFIAQLGGATSRIAKGATAYPHRDAAFVMNVHTRWQDRAEDDVCIAWARNVFDQSAAFANGGVYVNFMPNDETKRTEGAYGSNLDRLRKVKATFDPTNLFRHNQNIAPA
ncbi:MAG: FAD-binding oxidoreductase [Geminicoccales bacterium]